MRLFEKAKDGGPESPVDAYFLIESKRLGSIALLKFNPGCREAYHTHAFNALTWFLKGSMVEQDVDGTIRRYKRSLKPKVTLREKCHRVAAVKTSWCLTIRGPWKKEWKEITPQGEEIILTNGREVVSRRPSINLQHSGAEFPSEKASVAP